MQDYSLPTQTEFTGDIEAQQQAVDEQNAFDVKIKEQQEQMLQESAATESEAANKKDPRQDDDGDGKKDVQFNPGDIGAELSSAIGGGLQDAASSVATLPERAVDMFNGEMEEEGDDYRPEWDPFTDYDNPIETHTWWGGAIRGLVQFGGLAVGTVLTAKAGAVVAGGLGLAKVAGALSWLGAGTTGGLGTNIVRAGVVGGVGDVISRDSQKDNALGVLKEHHPWLDNPLATQDTDHPAMKTFKNVVESMGVGAVFDLAVETIGYGVKSLKNGKTPAEVIDARNTSVKNQTIERGKAEVAETEEFRGYKNKPIADVDQGNATSNGSVKDVQQQVKRIRTEMGAENGSTDSLVSARELKRMSDRADDMGNTAHSRILKELEQDPAVAGPIKAAKAEMRVGTQSAKDIEPEVLEAAREMLEGRNTTDMSTEEFFKPITDKAYTNPEIEGSVIRTKDVAVISMVNEGLMREVRDFASGAKDIVEVLDVTDIDGPLDAIKERIVYGMTLQNRANKLWSDQGRLRQDPNAKRTTKQELIQDKADIKEAVETMVARVKADTTDDSLKKLLDIFSKSEVNTFEDYKAFLLTKLKGGQLKKGGPKETGFLIKELQGVMVHSVLSGPKTTVRAVGGTGSMTFLKPLSQALGATMRGDITTARAALSEGNALIQSLPEAWKIFKTRLHSTWSGDVSTVNTRFSNYQAQQDEVWQLLGDFMESDSATLGDKAAFRIASMARGLNGNNFLTYSTKTMDAGDNAFNTLMVRAKLRGRATRAAIENGGVTPESMVKAQQNFLDEITNADGTMDLNKIKELDPEIFSDAAEVKLTTDLEGFSKSLQTVMEGNPWTRPFFLFARTGVNGLAMAAKHTPGINMILDKQRAIFTASADNLAPVMKYGIQTAEQLANAKALALGRQTMGASIIFMATQMHMNGNLRGSGPVDRQLRQTWIDAGYKRNTVRLGDVWVNYEAFEPFNQIITLVSDISDHSQLMGEEWTKNKLQQVTAIVAEGLTSKSYLASIGDMVDMFSGDPKAFGRLTGGLLNNQVPMSSMRNELGKLLSPHTRELNSDLWTSIRNRNQLTENGADALPIKYDLLNGQSIKDQDFPTRMFNMFSPLQFNLDGGKGRELLFRSQYDLRTSVLSYKGISFADNADLRSEFQRLIGEQNVEAELDKLAKDPTMMNSIYRMEKEAQGPNSTEPENYPHYSRIQNIFDKAKKKAWAQLSQNPEVKALIQEQRTKKGDAAKVRNDINKQNQLIRLIEMQK